jgi:hypothetical protein
MRQLGYLAREMFTHLDRRRSPWGLDFAVYLAFEGRFAGAARLPVPNRDLIEFAGGDPDPQTREGRREAFARFLSGVEDQRAWGARPDYGAWPEALRPDVDADRADGLADDGNDGTAATPRRMPRHYWKDFITASTAFVLPDDVADLNARAAGRQGGRAAPRPPRRRPHQAPAAEAPVTAAELRDLRRRLGFTQLQLAAHLGVSRPLLARLEAGSRRIGADVAGRVRHLSGGLLTDP